MEIDKKAVKFDKRAIPRQGKALCKTISWCLQRLLMHLDSERPKLWQMSFRVLMDRPDTTYFFGLRIWVFRSICSEPPIPRSI